MQRLPLRAAHSQTVKRYTYALKAFPFRYRGFTPMTKRKITSQDYPDLLDTRKISTKKLREDN
jgi:hypothetical protein